MHGESIDPQTVRYLHWTTSKLATYTHAPKQTRSPSARIGDARRYN